MQPKEDLRILNSREKKEVMKLINNQWDSDFSPDVLLESNNGKIYLVSRGMANIEWNNLNIDRVGLYFARLKDNKVRLTIEGSQLVGPSAKKNIIVIDDSQLKSWFRGEDLDGKFNGEGFVLLKHGVDFVGCGKVTSEKLLNFVPKARRAELI